MTAVRAAVAERTNWADTAELLVASALERQLPSPSILTAEQRTGDPESYRSEVLYSEPDGSFSIVALVWRPGQVTPIHDHVTWCVFGVIQGIVWEELFELDEHGAISIHVYGTDVARIGSSVRRYYDLPVRSRSMSDLHRFRLARYAIRVGPEHPAA